MTRGLLLILKIEIHIYLGLNMLRTDLVSLVFGIRTDRRTDKSLQYFILKFRGRTNGS